jgi:tRNA A-37 threonylcarbamoyl transferase component Bud32
MVLTGSRAVSIQRDVVVKVQSPEASRRERLRTLAGSEVARQTGLFVVPRIISFDDSRGEIVFERLELMALRPALSTSGKSVELVERAGQSLAAIHGYMKMAESSAGGTGSGTGQLRQPVPLHGDFGMRNVFYLPASNGIAVIDWANAHWMDFDADLGPPEIDLAVFLMSLFHRRPFGPWPISRRHELAQRFLASYACAAPQGLSIAELKATVAATAPGFNRQVYRRRGLFHALGVRHSMIDLHFFLRGLPQAD